MVIFLCMLVKLDNDIYIVNGNNDYLLSFCYGSIVVLCVLFFLLIL